VALLLFCFIALQTRTKTMTSSNLVLLNAEQVMEAFAENLRFHVAVSFVDVYNSYPSDMLHRVIKQLQDQKVIVVGFDGMKGYMRINPKLFGEFSAYRMEKKPFTTVQLNRLAEIIRNHKFVAYKDQWSDLGSHPLVSLCEAEKDVIQLEWKLPNELETLCNSLDVNNTTKLHELYLRIINVIRQVRFCMNVSDYSSQITGGYTPAGLSNKYFPQLQKLGNMLERIAANYPLILGTEVVAIKDEEGLSVKNSTECTYYTGKLLSYGETSNRGHSWFVRGHSWFVVEPNNPLFSSVLLPLIFTSNESIVFQADQTIGSLAFKEQKTLYSLFSNSDTNKAQLAKPEKVKPEKAKAKTKVEAKVQPDAPAPTFDDEDMTSFKTRGSSRK
jgi:hypothetical protein